MIVIGLILGVGGGVWGTMGCIKKPDPIVETKIIEKTIEVEKQLTDTHILRDICSDAFIEKRGEGLCRLMWCRANTRNALGTAQSATSKECESISNLLNKTSMLKICTDFSKDGTQDSDEQSKRFDRCIALFDRRI